MQYIFSELIEMQTEHFDHLIVFRDNDMIDIPLKKEMSQLIKNTNDQFLVSYPTDETLSNFYTTTFLVPKNKNPYEYAEEVLNIPSNCLAVEPIEYLSIPAPQEFF